MTIEYDDIDPQSTVDDFSPEKFELLCKKLAKQWAEENLIHSEYKIFYRKYEPIDIVVSEMRRNLNIPGQIIAISKKVENEHFIECKLYKGNLGLEVLGKAYLMTLRYKPKSLIIATNSSLTDRAIDFAQWLQVQLNDFVCTLWNPFANSPHKIRKSLGVPSRDFLINYVKPYDINNWQLFEENIFNRPVIADSNPLNKPRQITYNLNTTYSFEISINNNSQQKSALDLYLSFRDINHGRFTLPVNFLYGVNNIIQISGAIKNLKLQSNSILVDPVLIVKNKLGEDQLPIANFPTIIERREFYSLPDLRRGMAEEIGEKWLNKKRQPLLFIHGEGGIGKTYLCEQLCSNAKEDGYLVAHSPLTIESEPAFINELLWLLLPQKLRATLQSEDNADFTVDFLSTFFAQFGGTYNKQECTALRDILTYKKWHDKNPELITIAIARVISTATNRTLLLLSNCHRISSACAKTLQSLFASLESYEWGAGKIKIILEFRDNPEDETLEWLRLYEWLKNVLPNRIYSKKIKEISSIDLKSALNDVIISTENEIATNLIIEKSGGNPLYLKMLFHGLIENEILVPLNSNSVDNNYNLTSFGDLKNFVIELNADVSSILIKRINHWQQRLLKSHNYAGGYILALGAITNLNLSVKLLTLMTDLAEDKLEDFLLQFQNAGFVERTDNEHFRFAHEYIAASVLEWLDIQTDKFNIIQIAVKFCKPTDFETSFANGRLNSFLGRTDSAIVAFNDALQYSNEVYGKMYTCHKEILYILDKGKIAVRYISLFHSNLSRIVSIGGYFASAKELIDYNKRGIAILHKQDIVEFEKRAYYRQYHHNIAHLALKTNNLSQYFFHSEICLCYCQTPLEFSQFLNRLIKCATLIGDFDTGRKAGILALVLQGQIAEDEDPDLLSVNVGALCQLYSPVSLSQSSIIANYLLGLKASNRQLAHNFCLIASLKILDGNIVQAQEIINEIEVIVKKYDIFSMKLSLNSIRAFLDLQIGNIAAANEKYKAACIEAAWLDLSREELCFTNNHLVTSLFLGDLKNAKAIYKRIIFLIKKIIGELSHKKIEELFKYAQKQIEAHLQISKITFRETGLFPKLKTNKINCVSVVLANLLTVSVNSPELFPHPESFGILINEISNNSPIALNCKEVSFRFFNRSIILRAIC